MVVASPSETQAEAQRHFALWRSHASTSVSAVVSMSGTGLLSVSYTCNKCSFVRTLNQGFLTTSDDIIQVLGLATGS